MKNGKRILLIAIAVACFAVALSYPILYKAQEESNANTMEELAALREAGMAMENQATTDDEATEAGLPAQTQAAPAEAAVPNGEDAAGAADFPGQDGQTADGAMGASGEGDAEAALEAASGAEATPEPTGAAGAAPQVTRAPEGESAPEATREAGAAPQVTRAPEGESAPEATRAAGESEAGGQAQGDATEADAAGQTLARTPRMTSIASSGAEVPLPGRTVAPAMEALIYTASDDPAATPAPVMTAERRERTGVLPYPEKEKVEFDPERMLPRYKAIYELNDDLVGWISIPGTDVDYPVVQTAQSEFYLNHDFFGEENINGQIILDTLCDPYTPSYNLVISGHNMRSGSMFGNLDDYASKNYWQNHKFVQFDTLMDERQYVIFAAFYSADYDVDEEGFRYNADIQYRVDADQWLTEIRENQIYDTGIDVEFGDEFLTLTTCNHVRRSDGRFVLVCRRIREGETFE